MKHLNVDVLVSIQVLATKLELFKCIRLKNVLFEKTSQLNCNSEEKA